MLILGGWYACGAASAFGAVAAKIGVYVPGGSTPWLANCPAGVRDIIYQTNANLLPCAESRRCCDCSSTPARERQPEHQEDQHSHLQHISQIKHRDPARKTATIHDAASQKDASPNHHQTIPADELNRMGSARPGTCTSYVSSFDICG